MGKPALGELRPNWPRKGMEADRNLFREMPASTTVGKRVLFTLLQMDLQPKMCWESLFRGAFAPFFLGAGSGCIRNILPTLNSGSKPSSQKQSACGEAGKHALQVSQAYLQVCAGCAKAAMPLKHSNRPSKSLLLTLFKMYLLE